MARNVSREDYLVGRPPEVGQGDADVAGYLQGARAQLWRELHDQPLTMGGYCLLALWSGETMGGEDPQNEAAACLAPRLLDQTGLVHLPDNYYSFPAQGLAFPSLQITLPYFLLSHSWAPL